MVRSRSTGSGAGTANRWVRTELEASRRTASRPSGADGPTRRLQNSELGPCQSGGRRSVGSENGEAVIVDDKGQLAHGQLSGAFGREEVDVG